MFLSNHPTVTSLVLGSCGGASSCALRKIDLGHVKALECTSRCFNSVAKGQIVFAGVFLSDKTSKEKFTAVDMRSFSHIYSLTLEFHSNDYDVLDRVVRSAPSLVRLELIEKIQPQARPPFNDSLNPLTAMTAATTPHATTLE